VAAAAVAVGGPDQEDDAVDTNINPRQEALSPRRAGQALTELVVGLVAVMALLAGLIQIGLLTRAQTDVMIEARKEAAEAAMRGTRDGDFIAIPSYIHEVTAGNDGRTYSRDDAHTLASAEDFSRTIVDKSTADATDWHLLDAMPTRPFSDLRQSSTPAELFGLLEGTASETVDVIPAVRSLLYRADSIDVEASVWIPRTGDFY
jgi:hypothetical protein